MSVKMLREQPHSRARWRRPMIVRSNTAHHHHPHFGLLRSSCGHVIGLAWVAGYRQGSLVLKRCT